MTKKSKKVNKKQSSVEKENTQIINKDNTDKIYTKKDIKNKNKEHKKINIKKGLGKLIALIIVICMLLASSATLIFYLTWYLQ